MKYGTHRTSAPLAAIATRILKGAQSPAATRRYIPTQWPVIGGRSTRLMPFGGWSDPDISSHFENSTRIAVGVLSCPGLFGLARELQIPVFKISTTRDETAGFTHRLAALNADRYGADHRSGSSWESDDGFDGWELCALPQDLGLASNSPVQATPRALSIVLPQTLTPRAFDEALHRELTDISLSGWVNTPDGRGHLKALGLDPARYDRHTAYSLGGSEPRLSRARELYIYKPRLQAERLALVVEKIILQWLGNTIV